MHPLLMATLGGLLIGLASIILLAFNGRIAGISGIVAGLVESKGDERAWRAVFVGGMLLGGVALYLFDPTLFAESEGRSTGAVIAAGLLVGYGTRLGSGCTSGHGICGLSRLSIRSLVAVLAFMVTGAVTVYIVQHVLGGVV